MPVFWMPNYASSLTRFLAHIVCIILIYPYVFRLLFQHHARVCLPKTIIHHLDKKNAFKPLIVVDSIYCDDFKVVAGYYCLLV